MSERKAKAAIILASLSLLIYGLACIYSPISWSPDSSRIAALHLGMEGEEPSFEIWITDVESGESELLISSETGLSAPGWSPEGERIAYLRLVEKEGPEANLYVENLADGSRKRLASLRPMEKASGESDAFLSLSMLIPSWSPDGRQIALGCFEEEDKPFIAVIDAQTGEMKNILKDAGWPAWSPDGKWIAGLYAGENEAVKIIIISPDGKEKKVLVDLSEEENLSLPPYPVWAPDSKSIIYMIGMEVEEEGYAPHLFMVDLEGKEKEIVRIESDVGFFPAISPDGKSIAFVKGQEIGEGEEGVIVELALMNLETGEEKIVAQGFEVISMVSFSPDGRFLAYRFVGMGEDEEEEAHTSLIKILNLETQEKKIIAVNSYETALLAQYYFIMGQELIEQGKEEEGRKYLEKAEKVSGQYLDKYVDFESLEGHHGIRGGSLKELGKFEDAISQFKLLLALYEYRDAGKSEVLQAKFEMAGCYQALEKKPQARSIYEEILNEIPEDARDEHLKELRQKAAAKLKELKPREP